MKFKLYTLILGLVITSYGCQQPLVEKQLAEIDSLANRIDNIEALVLEINVDSLSKYSKQMSADLKTLHDYYQDTISWEKAKFLSSYHRINKAFGKYIDKSYWYTEEIEFSKKQLADLKHDLEKGIIVPDSFSTYFSVEIKSTEDLGKMTSDEIARIKKLIIKYKQSNPKLNELLLQRSGYAAKP